MSNVIDLSSHRIRLSPSAELLHPAGVRVPFDESAFVDFLIPEVRGDISNGDYSAELIRHVADAVSPGDRALVIGAGLGIVSSLIAKTGRADRILAVEADPRLVPCLKRVHAMNGAAWVETVHGVLSTRTTGLTNFFPHRDIRDSSLLPNLRTDLPVLVPCLDVNLILADEQINLIVCDLPSAPLRLLADAELDRVDRILIDCSSAEGNHPSAAEFAEMMTERGFAAQSWDGVVLFEREGATRRDAVTPPNWETQACG